ncbi:MAG TPA: sensor histidine kinase [Miltoncostaeaceae bacterium]|nr:sensor histidine kinase [Miltoncostaeaceae bacterium]
MSIFRRYVAAPLTEGRALRSLAFVASAIPLGTAWLVMLVTGWSLGLGLLITLLGIPVILVLGVAVRGAAALERRLADGLLGTSLAGAARPLWTGGPLRSLWCWLTDPAWWREQAYLLLRFVVGLPLGILALSVIAQGLQALTLPFYYYATDDQLYGVWDVDTFSEAILLVPAGALLLILSVPLVTALGALSGALARGVLGTGERRSEGPARRSAGGPALRLSRPTRRGLTIHAAVSASIVLVLIVIWAATTPGGYFWPVWPFLVLGLVLGIHAAWVLTPALVPDAGPRGVALARHGGVMAMVMLFLTLIWAVTTPGGYFWPIWTFTALASAFGIHAGIQASLGRRREAEATERIEVLQETRAGAVDAQASELRRIERDLHDGAQARLVALAMDLGMAKERVDDPEVREQVTRAHEEAKRAIVELRDLARGIHPAVLTDRGLEAALGSLAGASRLSVELNVDAGGRLDPALEAAAYFTVAEALANAAKHSGATSVRIDVARRDDLLSVRVADDGIGGADPDGEGLIGLRRRVEAHDGRLVVDSPPGRGTILTAELPCGS